MKAMLIATIAAVAATEKVQLTADFIPSETFANRQVHLPELSYQEMLEHRKTQQYQDFLNGPLVQTVHMLMYPFMQEMAPAPKQIVENEDEWAIAPWSDNLIRWNIRFNLRPICWFLGNYEVMWMTTVQTYYDCMTW